MLLLIGCGSGSVVVAFLHDALLLFTRILRCMANFAFSFPIQIPKVAATCNFGAIMDGYYKILFPLNPSSIRPVMPSGCEHEFLSQPHNRTSLSLVDKNVQVPVL